MSNDSNSNNPTVTMAELQEQIAEKAAVFPTLPPSELTPVSLPFAIVVTAAAEALRQCADRLDTYGAFSASATNAYLEHSLKDLGLARDTVSEHAQLLIEMASDTHLPISARRLGDALGVAHTTIRRWMTRPRDVTATRP